MRKDSGVTRFSLFDPFRSEFRNETFTIEISTFDSTLSRNLVTLQQFDEFLSNLNESNPFGSEGISIKSKQLSFVIQKKRVETDDFFSAVKLHSTECARNFPIWNSTAPSVWKSKRIPRGAPPVFASFWRANDAHRPKYIDTRYTHTHTHAARGYCVCVASKVSERSERGFAAGACLISIHGTHFGCGWRGPGVVDWFYANDGGGGAGFWLREKSQPPIGSQPASSQQIGRKQLRY